MPVKLKQLEDRFEFRCVGCKSKHHVLVGEGSGPRWTWNGSLEKPTFSPSLLVTWREPANFFDKERMKADLDANREQGVPIPYADRVCHSFITDGKIQFLGDCTHEMAGKTLELLDIE